MNYILLYLLLRMAHQSCSCRGSRTEDGGREGRSARHVHGSLEAAPETGQGEPQLDLQIALLLSLSKIFS